MVCVYFVHVCGNGSNDDKEGPSFQTFSELKAKRSSAMLFPTLKKLISMFVCILLLGIWVWNQVDLHPVIIRLDCRSGPRVISIWPVSIRGPYQIFESSPLGNRVILGSTDLQWHEPSMCYVVSVDALKTKILGKVGNYHAIHQAKQLKNPPGPLGLLDWCIIRTPIRSLINSCELYGLVFEMMGSTVE